MAVLVSDCVLGAVVWVFSLSSFAAAFRASLTSATGAAEAAGEDGVGGEVEVEVELEAEGDSAVPRGRSTVVPLWPGPVCSQTHPVPAASG